MFREKIINVSSNLKRGLHLGTKIKSNECLDIETEGVLFIMRLRGMEYYLGSMHLIMLAKLEILLLVVPVN